MSRFEAIGHSVYEKGDRIGCTPDEAAVELARKLNAYQMRVERLKAKPHDDDTCPHLVRANLLEAENARLKAEVEELKALTAEMDSTINVSQAACREYKAEVERLEEIVGSDAIDRKYGMCCDASDEIARLKAEVERVGAENAHLHKGIYSLSLNVAQLKDEVERLTKAGDFMADCLGSNSCWSHLDGLVADWNAAKEGKQPNG